MCDRNAQRLVDRYIAGESVPIDSVRLAWRNTTQLLAWDSPLYERFYETVRALNATRPRDRRFRVVAGDPPIDWSRTNRAEDIPRSYGFRDIETIGIIEREVLGKGRRALVIIGEEHVPRSTGLMPDGRAKPLERMSLGEALHARHPGVAFLVATVNGEASPLARASAVTYGAEYEQEIRRRIEILERFYGVDIWTEDLDRLRRAPP